MELMIASLIGTMTVGAAIAMMSRLSEGYTTQQDEAMVQDEARFALEQIEEWLRMAGSDPYEVSDATICPAVTTAPFQPIQIDPSVPSLFVRIHADVNPPNGCHTDANEDVTIAYDAQNQTITTVDNNAGVPAVPITDSVISGLVFSYFSAADPINPLNSPIDPTTVASVHISVTAQSPGQDRFLGQAPTFTLESRVRIRGR